MTTGKSAARSAVHAVVTELAADEGRQGYRFEIGDAEGMVSMASSISPLAATIPPRW